MLSLLRMRLHQAIDCQSTVAEVTVAEIADAACLPLTQCLSVTALERSRLDETIQVVPIKRLNKAIPFLYGCAIAHRFATPSQPAPIIAAHLVDALLQQHSLQRDALTSGIVIQATATGLIQFELGDRAIAAWLDGLLDQAVSPPLFVPIAAIEPPIALPSAAIFEVQSAHARCCSLLRLAHREALITLDGDNAAPLTWRIASPPSIPWLTSTAQLCLKHPADRYLLGHLVEARDCLSERSPQRTQRTLRSTQAIAQAMQAFHRVHPLWRKTDLELDLVTAHLGLLLATQRILSLLLTEGLHLYPVVEL